MENERDVRRRNNDELAVSTMPVSGSKSFTSRNHSIYIYMMVDVPFDFRILILTAWSVATFFATSMGSSKESDDTDAKTSNQGSRMATLERGPAVRHDSASDDDGSSQYGVEGSYEFSGMGDTSSSQSYSFDQPIVVNPQASREPNQYENLDDENRFFDKDTSEISSDPLVYYVGDSSTNVVVINLIANPTTGDTELVTRSVKLDTIEWYLESRFLHQNQIIVRLRSKRSPQKFININVEEFKRNFSMFNKNQISRLTQIKELRGNEWEEDNLSKSLLSRLPDVPVRSRVSSTTNAPFTSLMYPHRIQHAQTSSPFRRIYRW